MILLTRLDNSKVLINIDAVKAIESTPDSLVSFLNGDSLIVRESLDEIIQHVIDFKTSILAKTFRDDSSV